MPEVPISGESLDLDDPAACEGLADDLANAAGALEAGEDLAASHPGLARHLEECERCRAILYDLMRDPDLQSEAQFRVRRSELFERSMAEVLESGEPVARERAADQLGGMGSVGAAALAALAEAAAGDEVEEVRTAAGRALQRLEAGVAALAGEAWTAEQQLELVGKEGVSGHLSVEQGELRLAIKGLPSSFEKTRPVVALPGALRPPAWDVEWFGKDPGLVAAETPVEGGRLNVRLGRLGDPEGEAATLDRVYVLNPRTERKRPA